MAYFIAFVQAFRPKQWVKNIFVFPALIFADRFTDTRSIVLAMCAFWIFSFAASAVYLVNDIADYEADRNHPIKKHRPIASGKISRSIALLTSIILMGGVTITSLVLSPLFTLVITMYFINNLLYSFGLKHQVIIDILMVAFGFVLRAVGGAVAIDVPISAWFLVITFLFTLFIAIMKRRQEFIEISKNGGKKRKVLEHYSVAMLDQMANITIPAVLVSYIFFTFQTFHTEYFIFTIPFVVYGIFRYLYLVHKKELGEDPTMTLLRDLPLALCVIVWGVVSMGLLYFYE
jgi:4-hydroxybenzoate polyprenyltransferase